MNPFVVSMLLSLAPISELRGGIPVAISSGINPWLAFFCCVLANIAVIPLVFLFLEFVHSKLTKIKSYKKTFNVFLKKTRRKINKVKKGYQLYGFVALTVFVAIPLPITGAWSGTLISWILGLNKLKSSIAIAFGILIAGIITTAATLGILTLF